MITLTDTELYLPDFADIWFTNCNARYRCLKGARETGKSYNFIGLESVFKILSDERINIMMIRQNDKDNANSTFTMIKAICYKLGVNHLFQFKVSPHEIIRKDTGQKIMFGGMNDVENITSTTPQTGFWTDIYFEEASQLKSYEDFRVIDGSLRLPCTEDAEGLFNQITFCFNAWDVGHWLCDVFFKDNLEDDIPELEENRYQYKLVPDFNIGQGKGLALHTSSYRTNIYRAKTKDEDAAILKEKAYDIYLVEKLGCWGNTADRTYAHFTDSLIIPEQKANNFSYDAIVIGIDTGLSNGEGKIKYSEENAKRLSSAMTMQLVGVTNDWNKVVGLDEYFDSNIGRATHEKKTEPQYIKEMLHRLREWEEEFDLWDTEIYAYVDCADVGFRDSLEALAPDYGLDNITFLGSTKQKILTRVRFENLLMSFGEMLFSTRCKNLVREIKNARKAKDGKCREDFDDHAINAWEYAWAVLSSRLRRWKSFKVQD